MNIEKLQEDRAAAIEKTNYRFDKLEGLLMAIEQYAKTCENAAEIGEKLGIGDESVRGYAGKYGISLARRGSDHRLAKEIDADMQLAIKNIFLCADPYVTNQVLARDNGIAAGDTGAIRRLGQCFQLKSEPQQPVLSRVPQFDRLIAAWEATDMGYKKCARECRIPEGTARVLKLVDRALDIKPRTLP